MKFGGWAPVGALLVGPLAFVLVKPLKHSRKSMGNPRVISPLKVEFFHTYKLVPRTQENMEPKKNTYLKEEHHLPSTSMLGFKMLIFQAVYKTALLAGILQEVIKSKTLPIWVPGEISPQKLCSDFTLPGPYL